jgi:hypothetical protein
VGRNPRQFDVVHENAALVRFVELCQEFDQRGFTRAVLANQRDHGTGGQIKGDILEHLASGAWIGERHVVEADSADQSRWCGPIGRRDERGNVVLQPGEPNRAIHPDPAEESNLSNRGADVGRQSRSRCENEQDTASVRGDPPGDEDDCADITGAEDCPGESVPGGGCPPGSSVRSIPAFPDKSAIGRELIADAHDANVLAGRRRSRNREEMTGEAA